MTIPNLWAISVVLMLRLYFFRSFAIILLLVASLGIHQTASGSADPTIIWGGLSVGYEFGATN